MMTPEFLHLGPVILKTKLDDVILNEIHHHVDLLLTQQHQDYSSNLAGKNKYQYLLEYEVVHNIGLEEILLNTGYSYLDNYNYTQHLSLKDIWVNICQESDYNPIHCHGGTLSGIIYLEVPKAENDTNGHTQFVFGQHMPFSNSLLTLLPDPGTILMFPSWLMHTAYPSKNSLNRKTISFNLGN